MRTVNKKSEEDKKWKITWKPVYIYQSLFYIIMVLIVAAGGAFLTVNKMTERTESVKEIQSQMEYRIDQTIDILESLACQSRFYDPSLPPQEKVATVDQLNEYLGYMMICYVDQNMDVYSAEGPTSLASRDYMQKLFATGKTQITDSIVAGSDGVTLNYTIAVPLVQDGVVTGCIFCAIYFDDIVKILEDHQTYLGVDSALLGSQNQIMSATGDMSYGENYITRLKHYKLKGTSGAEIESNLLNHQADSFWRLGKGDISYTSYLPIAQTEWKLLSTADFSKTYLTLLPSLIWIIVGGVVLFGLMMFLVSRYIKVQMKTVDILVNSVQELEHKIYQEDRPDNVNFSDILQMTSKGLSDGLTGVVTRSVFVDQFRTLLRKENDGKIKALCFVDLDDLKKINDTYGHERGDISLKSVGYVLREYEKKYNGLVGRYGGDEFVLLLTDIDTDTELREVLDELALRLHMEIGENGNKIPIQCSIGVSVWDGEADDESLIKSADEALYFVKQNGKGYYRIYQDEKS